MKTPPCSGHEFESSEYKNQAESKSPKAKDNIMELKVERFQHNENETFGKFYIEGVYQCFTLEDPYKEKKVWGETRIPEGRYKVELRKAGGFHEKYTEKFGKDFHRGMLHVTNVPNYTYILIHIGNTNKDTNGCLLVGTGKTKNSITNSTLAYKKIYPPIAKALEEGKEVWITYTT